MSKSKTREYIFLVTCVLVRWFLKDIFFGISNLPDLLYPFAAILFIAILFAFIMLIVLVIYFFIDGVRNIKKQKFKAFVAFVLCLATFMFVTFFPVLEFRGRVEYYCFKPMRDRIVEEIKESDVTYIDKGVKLPWYVAFVSMDGEIYVNKNGDHVSVVFLYMEGYDLSTSNYIEYSNEKQKDNRYINDGEDRIVKRFGENWYYVQAG